jgi:hypothetical protein
MSKIVNGILLFLVLSMAVLVMAFDSHFYNRYFYDQLEGGNGSGWGFNTFFQGFNISRDDWATALRDSSKESFPHMWRGLQASIAFAALTSLLSLIGIGVGCSSSSGGKKVIGILLIVSLIGLLVSVATWVGADKSDDAREVSFHKPNRDTLDLYMDNSIDIPGFLKNWRDAYYGSIVCMVLAVFLGLIASVLLIKD